MTYLFLVTFVFLIDQSKDGPLTYAQLQNNMPPLLPPGKLQEVLDIMVALGVLSIVDEENTRAKLLSQQKGDAGTPAASASASSVAAPMEIDVNGTTPETPSVPAVPPTTCYPVRYVFLKGQPRFDNITVPDVIDLLELSEKEVNEMTDRIKMLREELVKSAASRRSTATGFLTEMMQKYPYLSNDELYSAALESCQISDKQR